MPASRSEGRPGGRRLTGYPPQLMFLAGVPVIGFLAARTPLLAAGGVLLTGTLAVGMASPIGFVMLAALLSAAIPKSGVNLGGLPLPLMMFVLLLAAPMLRPHAARERHRPGARLGVAALVWLVYRLVALYFDGGSVADLLALAGWYGLPVALLLAGPPVGGLVGRLGEQWTRRMEAGVMIACFFSFVQQFGGIERTAIPGITRAVGADYSLKPLAFEGGSKIPSTYQNGNIFGVITAFFFLISADRVIRGIGTRRDGLILAVTAAASVLSGSRTILAGLAIGLVVLLVRSKPSGRVLAVCTCSALSLAAVLVLSPALADRLTGTTVNDPALAQRTVVWWNVLRTTPLQEFAIGGPEWGQFDADPGLAEGLIGAVQQVGVLGMGLFLGTFFAATNAPHLRRWRILFLPVAVSLAVDSAYLVFPTVFLPLARMFSPIAPGAEPADVDAPDDEPAYDQLVPQTAVG